MPQPAALLFGIERARRDMPDASAIAESVVSDMIERATRAEANVGDVAALVVLDLTARLCAYGRSDLQGILAALATSVPTRAALLHEANKTGAEPPGLSTARFGIAGANRLH